MDDNPILSADVGTLYCEVPYGRCLVFFHLLASYNTWPIVTSQYQTNRILCLDSLSFCRASEALPEEFLSSYLIRRNLSIGASRKTRLLYQCGDHADSAAHYMCRFHLQLYFSAWRFLATSSGQQSSKRFLPIFSFIFDRDDGGSYGSHRFIWSRVS